MTQHCKVIKLDEALNTSIDSTVSGSGLSGSGERYLIDHSRDVVIERRRRRYLDHARHGCASGGAGRARVGQHPLLQELEGLAEGVEGALMAATASGSSVVADRSCAHGGAQRAHLL